MNCQSHQTAPTRRRLRLIAAAVPLVLAGCTSSSSTSTAAELNRALQEYDAKRYAAAGQRAGRARRGARGVVRNEAAYLGGLCAYRMGDLDEAEARLTEAAESSHRPTAGRARAVLGLVLLEQDRPAEAADRFADAFELLAGDDARRAAAHAALAHERAGDQAAAAAWHEVAAADAGRPGPGGISGAGSFTLQVGAFRSRAHAERAARDAAPIAERHALSPLRIETRRDGRGSALYVVQLGRFDTRTAAVNARARVGNLRFIVAALPAG